MKKKELRGLIAMLWPSHTTKAGTVYEPLTPELFADLWIAADKFKAEEAMVRPHLKAVS